MRKKISVVLLTYNEEVRVSECLKSVAWADEVVVVDSGSTDRTLALCRAIPRVHIFNHSWQGFGKQRDYAVSLAKHDWVLSLDADERVSLYLAKEILDLLESEPAGKIYRIPFKNIFLGRWLQHGGMYPDSHLRLFHRKYGRFNHNPVHEQVETKQPSKNLNAFMEHLLSKDLSHYVAKINRYTDLEAAILYEHGVQPTGYDLFLKPLLRFFNAYIARKGFADGVPGFLFAFLRGIYFFLIYQKLYEQYKWKPSILKMIFTIFKRNKKNSHGYPSQAFSCPALKKGNTP